MSEKTLPLDYANILMFEMQKAFYDERGKGARFRMTTVGREFFKENILPKLSSKEIDTIINTIDSVLTEKGIVAKVSFVQEDRLIKVKIASCIHKSIEEKMVAKGVEPFTCIPANMIVLAIEEKLDQPVELAEIKIEEGACNLLLVMFEKRPSLD